MRHYIFIYIFVFLTSCSTLVIEMDQGESSLKQSETKGSWITGIFELTDPLIPLCKPVSITIRRSALDAIIHFFIGGIYTTRRVDVFCPVETDLKKTGNENSPIKTGSDKKDQDKSVDKNQKPLKK